jgi:hypothetical protein
MPTGLRALRTFEGIVSKKTAGRRVLFLHLAVFGFYDLEEVYSTLWIDK